MTTVERAPDATASITVDAAPEQVWRAIVDLATGRPDGETFSGRWVGGAGPSVGARFRGWNRNGVLRWRTTGRVTECDPGRAFGFRVTSLGMAVADWRFELTQDGGGATVLRESTWDRRGPILRVVAPLATGVLDRATRNQRNIEQTLAHLRSTIHNTPL
ncbi:SRPBCC family protein [Pseudonocardia spinosispora]|uniref:SRPBCC family protein n=1 Tax=Pseudonocardia spinosispora TaxID=103441 RepID=UPI0003F5CB9B|nr:SRPBCC family protein [Pseudonocardia spinosispora]